jgi:uncharacterized membrane protein YfbV (UPF0208 family)
VKLNQGSDGSYSLNLDFKLNGGGIMGANIGFWTGKFLTNFLPRVAVYSVAWAAGFFGGHLGAAAGSALCSAFETTFAVPLAAASNVTAVAFAIAGGTATGPV